MAEARYAVKYQTSPLGRATFTVFLCASLAGVIFIALPLVLLGLQAGGEMGWLTAAGAVVAALMFSALSVMAGLRAFGPGERITLTNEGFKYDGLFRVSRIRWSEIESFRLTRGDFVSRLRVRTKPEARGGARLLIMDVGGLAPKAEDLVAAFSEASGLEVLPEKPLKKKKA
ncbi:MAG TPA: hypothetical protein VH105_11740 [Burkholderiales bacterium]|jgi:hypothetical protein|nr:hypothetical protein [Burkholderiales bacterium]